MPQRRKQPRQKFRPTDRSARKFVSTEDDMFILRDGDGNRLDPETGERINEDGSPLLYREGKED